MVDQLTINEFIDYLHFEDNRQIKKNISGQA